MKTRLINSMDDKRVIKTKRNFKLFFIELLLEMPFEKITVAELCRRGESSRITFYNYYENMLSLVNDIFDDYFKEIALNYVNLQRVRNPEKNGIKSYNNALECVLNMYFAHYDFFLKIDPKNNPFLFTYFEKYLVNQLNEYIKEHAHILPPRYESRKIAALLGYGLWGVVDECDVQNVSDADVRSAVQSIFKDLLNSGLFKI